MFGDSLYYPNSSRRMVSMSNQGMVATSQPIAAQVGLEILKNGGNAVDAAIATAAALTVVEPTSNGIGGDAFAIVWIDGEMHGLNASGKSPASISIDAVKALGHKEMPLHGMVPITVPGAPAAWIGLSKRFGNLPFKELLTPAIEIARRGFPVSPTVHQLWEEAYDEYKVYQDPIFDAWYATFAPNGKAPCPGEVWKSEDHANTLTLIAETEAKAFYQGELANEIETFCQNSGGFLRKDDLMKMTPEWVSPISTRFRGYDIWEIPPNGSGIIALQALAMLDSLSEKVSGDPVETLHQRIEATKLAYSDGLKFVTEHSAMGVSVEDLLLPSYLEKRKELISQEAIDPVNGNPITGGTVYLATADKDGNMVSFIQSNFKNFGSGVVVPGTGISLQNRGWSFSLDSNHYNSLQPGKRTYHTIIPGFITKAGKAIGPFGVMGGFMQPQGHVQLLAGMFVDGLNPQAALDTPRWKWVKGKTIEVEPHFPDHLAQALSRRGHHIIKSTDSITFGRGQVILRDPNTGVLYGGTEPRTDSSLAVW
ncbi:gamma-glutamyltransferase family protein [Vreelandella neptunia]|uniref:Gamma-glutamyltransferase family protein n=1 Tax=Vreelandella neptunia TaxID=115551 RepID=A0ABZ0YLS6_9GAMM|nr:gamma-glutamyltransferase family protein [Halomonas neptunia]MDN3560488.1 gamma-glutamyltransferase family protein [Halomonas neptunia]WQH12272.1 gamma-glutamyltransferase family protein [Halomonas neptunia]